eukprot:g3880.t1
MLPLEQIHMHWSQEDNDMGSEHAFNGKTYALEAHMVHQRADLGSVANAANVAHGATTHTKAPHTACFESVTGCWPHSRAHLHEQLAAFRNQLMGKEVGNNYRPAAERYRRVYKSFEDDMESKVVYDKQRHATTGRRRSRPAPASLLPAGSQMSCQPRSSLPLLFSLLPALFSQSRLLLHLQAQQKHKEAVLCCGAVKNLSPLLRHLV